MRNRIGRFTPTTISLATAYADQGGAGDELVIPESFDGMEYADVRALFDSAVEQFDALHAAEGDRTPEQLELLTSLAEGIEALNAELQERDALVAEREAQASELASRVQALRADTSDDEAAPDEEGSDDEGGEDDESEDEPEADDESAAQTEALTAAGGRREVRVPLSSISRRKTATPPPAAAPSISDVLISSSDSTGFAIGSGLSFLDAGKAIDRKLSGYNHTQYAAAARMGRSLRERQPIAQIKREFAADQIVGMEDSQARVEEVLSRVTDEHRVVGKSGAKGLVAAGGWCAPSETTYELIGCEASRDGLLSLPEVQINRGGLRFPVLPSYQELYDGFPGFHFTEEDDENGAYTPGEEGNVEGPKPCQKIDCPEWSECRLEVDGLCVQAGILANRGFPEYIARTIQQVLIAHAHKMSAGQIAKIVAGSEAVTFPSGQVGATAPLLTAIELQAESIRYANRLARNTTMEGIFPYWVRGAIRADLARREGLAMFEVSDAQIDNWFRSHGIAPQYVYDWQPFTGTGSSALAYPAQVSFVMYPAGTWFRGVSDLITLENIYDSTLLANNDFTALFTEEGWMVCNRGCSSRVVTVPLCPNGATGAAVEIACNGTAVPAAVVPGSSAETPLFTSAVTDGE